MRSAVNAIRRSLQRLISDHGDGTNHEWGTEHGFIFECRQCGAVEWEDDRID